MDAERWQKIKRTLMAALERDPDERSTFLASACGEDRKLREQVETLLRTDRSAEDFLESPILGALETPPPSPVREGDRVGGYRILEELGRGGMGVVYRAEKLEDEYGLNVALKILSAGWASESVRQRFHTEGHILSQLVHPNIARLLDGGTTDDGLPYLAIEYVDGLPIHHYCRTNGLSLEERLELVVQVCDAIQFAHRHLVVHRDLKPGNILVTSDGVPKLLDFGIAKLLAVEPGGDLTRTGHRPMTPEYAAPEQVMGGVISTATDIYGLGALLYTLVTDQVPFRVESGRLDDLLRSVCLVEPERPSRALRRSRQSAEHSEAEEPELLGTSRGAPPRLRRSQAADLDAIVLEAMAKEPEDRYASVAQLVDDLRRFLVGDAVTAPRGSVLYRAAKVTRRHWKAVAAVGIVLALTIGWATSLALQRREILSERARAENVTSFLVDMFEAVSPSKSRGSAVTAREILDLGSQRIRTELSDQPELQASLMTTMGTIFNHLGLYHDAEELLAGSLALQDRLGSEPGAAYADTLDQLGRALQRDGRFTEAASLHRRAIEVRRRSGGDELSLMESMNSLGAALWSGGDLAPAEVLLREVLERALDREGDDGPTTAAARMNLSMLLLTKGDYEEAEALARRSLDVTIREHGRAHPGTASSLEHMGRIQQQMGRYDEAEASFRDALALQRQLFGEEDPRIVTTLTDLSTLARDRGDVQDSETLSREALAMGLRIYGEGHPELTTLHSNLGLNLEAQGRLDEAAVELEEALRVGRLSGKDQQMGTSTALNNLALLREAQGKLAEAVAMHLENLELRKAIYGDEHLKVANTLNNLASSLRAEGNFDEAEARYREALEMLTRLLGPEHRYVALVMANLATVRLAAGDFEGAETLARRALEMQKKLLGPDHPDTAKSSKVLADALKRQGQSPALKAAEAEAI